MIAIKFIRLIHLFSYVLVTSQVLFYLYILADALKAITLKSYFEQRKVIDSMMNGRFRVMYYSCLALSVIVVVMSASRPASYFFISAIAALVLLAIDLAITVKGSLPLNALSHSFGSNSENVDWENVRTRWLDFMKYRGMAISLGMAALLAGLVFEK